ncbi:hypothetical protein [Corynebacterium heidelbergense]|uniref:hypothetical protein n=1 Tax=Corynebacterium heidelbergense TaxID=2055947 RepID=UPI001057F037|nr:hypothetical protein [Corynebacterium heidelbergense]
MATPSTRSRPRFTRATARRLLTVIGAVTLTGALSTIPQAAAENQPPPFQEQLTNGCRQYTVYPMAAAPEGVGNPTDGTVTISEADENGVPITDIYVGTANITEPLVFNSIIQLRVSARPTAARIRGIRTARHPVTTPLSSRVANRMRQLRHGRPCVKTDVTP